MKTVLNAIREFIDPLITLAVLMCAAACFVGAGQVMAVSNNWIMATAMVAFGSGLLLGLLLERWRKPKRG